MRLQSISSEYRRQRNSSVQIAAVSCSSSVRAARSSQASRPLEAPFGPGGRLILATDGFYLSGTGPRYESRTVSRALHTVVLTALGNGPTQPGEPGGPAGGLGRRKPSPWQRRIRRVRQGPAPADQHPNGRTLGQVSPSPRRAPVQNESPGRRARPNGPKFNSLSSM